MLEPDVIFVRQSATNFIYIFWQSYIDSCYSDAVVISTQSIMLKILGLAFGAITGLQFGFIAKTYYDVRNLVRKNVTNKYLIRPLPRLMRSFYLALFLLIGVFSIELTALFLIYLGMTVSVQASASYERRVMALSNIITEEERGKIISKWAFVQSKTDYEKVMQYIETLANKYEVNLPKRFI